MALLDHWSVSLLQRRRSLSIVLDASDSDAGPAGPIAWSGVPRAPPCTVRKVDLGPSPSKASRGSLQAVAEEEPESRDTAPTSPRDRVGSLRLSGVRLSGRQSLRQSRLSRSSEGSARSRRLSTAMEVAMEVDAFNEYGNRAGQAATTIQRMERWTHRQGLNVLKEGAT